MEIKRYYWEIYNKPEYEMTFMQLIDKIEKHWDELILTLENMWEHMDTYAYSKWKWLWRWTIPNYKKLNRGKFTPYDDEMLLKSGEYINASKVYLNAEESEYMIATQGPTKKTRGRFWEMVVDNDIENIVMLGDLDEEDSDGDYVEACHKYWSSSCEYVYHIANENSQYSKIKVMCEKKDGPSLSWTITLKITYKDGRKERKQITHH